jgi:hypothetical protein
MDELVTVAAFPDVSEAELARDRLGLEGIRAFVVSGQTGTIMPFLTASTGGVRVQVAHEDAVRAKEILAS